jgi:heme exporter protein A
MSPPNSRPLLEVKGLAKHFNGVPVLRNLDLEIEGGETVVIYGANGAGKTTLLRIIATLASGQAGTLYLKGESYEELGTVRTNLFYCGHGTQLYDELIPEENLRFFLRLHGRRVHDDEVRRVLETVGLWRFRHVEAGRFSAGMKRRLSFARVMLLKPLLLLLDEPYTSLDKAGVRMVNDFLEQLVSDGHSCVMANHSPELVATLQHKPLWLNQGKLQAEDPAHVA